MVMDWLWAQDNEFKIRILREGTNGWICLPDRQRPGIIQCAWTRR
jgi:hypothetical protein